MIPKFNTIFGIFKTRNETQETMDSLFDEGFGTTEISILFPENASPQNNLTTTSSGLLSSRTVNDTLELLHNPRTLHISGYGPLIAAGPAMEFLNQISNGNAGWLSQYLLNLGIPEYESKRYEENVDESGFLLAVDCRESAQEKIAKQILTLRGARYIAATMDTGSNAESTTFIFQR